MGKPYGHHHGDRAIRLPWFSAAKKWGNTNCETNPANKKRGMKALFSKVIFCGFETWPDMDLTRLVFSSHETIILPIGLSLQNVFMCVSVYVWVCLKIHYPVTPKSDGLSSCFVLKLNVALQLHYCPKIAPMPRFAILIIWHLKSISFCWWYEVICQRYLNWPCRPHNALWVPSGCCFGFINLDKSRTDSILKLVASPSDGGAEWRSKESSTLDVQWSG